jgi:hypothetical protein
MYVTERNESWELVDLSLVKDVIGAKPVYKMKHQEDGSLKGIMKDS